MPKKFINIFNTKIAASSIVEVIIALTICMIIFFMASTVILQSQKSNNIRLKQKAQFLLAGIEFSGLNKDSLTQDGSLRIEKIILVNDTLKGLSQVNFSIFDNLGHKVAYKVIWIKTNTILENEGNIE